MQRGSLGQIWGFAFDRRLWFQNLLCVSYITSKYIVNCISGETAFMVPYKDILCFSSMLNIGMF